MLYHSFAYSPTCILTIDDDDDVEIQDFDYDPGRKTYDDLLVIKVHDETVNNTFVDNFAVMKPGVTIDDIPHMKGCIVDMEDGSSVAEFTYPANRSSFFDEEEKWKASLSIMKGQHCEKLNQSFTALMTYFESQPVVLKTTRIDFGEELTNQFLSDGLPTGALDRMSVPFVYDKEILTGVDKYGDPKYKTYTMNEFNVVWRPVIANSDRPIKGAKKKSAKTDQDLVNATRMLGEM